MWIFGYGSLIFRPGFDFEERHAARLHGFRRRFFQGSPDHRGTPEAPGRVVTLLEQEGDFVDGVAFRLDPAVAERALPALDHREKGGYARAERPVELPHVEVNALVYWARPGNPNYIGEAPIGEMAAHIAASRGPSGHNLEYLTKLKHALDELERADAHVDELYAAVKRLSRAT
jgi:cation transport regulator ChaC